MSCATVLFGAIVEPSFLVAFIIIFQLKEKKKQAKKEGKDKIEEEEDPEKVLCQEIMAGERLLFVLVIICTAIQTPK